MSQQIFAFIVHKDGKPDDTAFELPVAAKKIFPDAQITGIVCGSNVDDVCNAVLKAYNEVWKVDNDGLAYPNAEIIRGLLASLLPEKSLLLVAHDTFGMDLSPGLAIKLDAAFVSDVADIEGMDGQTLKLVRQEYSGMVSTHVTCDTSNGAIINIRPGVCQPDENAALNGGIVDKSGDAGDIAGVGRKFLEIVQAEVGDVDITKSEVLVSVGRGIEDQDNLEIIHELAEAMGADVSCSRPIVDAKWMEKSRQVGTSGQTVKPKVYMALGISGSFQHLGGIKGSPYIVAVNKNPKAPIFQVADVGVVADILEFVPELAEKVEEMK